MLNLEWFTKHNFAASYKVAKKKKAMLVYKQSQRVVADFGDRKNKLANPVIEVRRAETGELMIVSRIVNFQHELRQVAQDVPVELVLDGKKIAKVGSISEILDEVE